jgi:hypothetical protein
MNQPIHVARLHEIRIWLCFELQLQIQINKPLLF